MKFKYSFNGEEEKTAKASGLDLSISTKKSVEICRTIRGKALKDAKSFLEKVIKKEMAVQMKRYLRDTPHRKGIGPGKYPIKTAEGILRLLKNGEANADNLGLDVNNLVILHISAHKATKAWHYGRKKRRKMKRTHIEIVLKEAQAETETKK